MRSLVPHERHLKWGSFHYPHPRPLEVKKDVPGVPVSRPEGTYTETVKVPSERTGPVGVHTRPTEGSLITVVLNPDLVPRPSPNRPKRPLSDNTPLLYPSSPDVSLGLSVLSAGISRK